VRVEAFRLLLAFVCAAGGYRLMRVAAGNDDSNAVDLYNSLTGRWSTAQLSVRRISLAATSVGHLAIFAGGFQYDSGNCCFAMCDGGFVLGLLCVFEAICLLLAFVCAAGGYRLMSVTAGRYSDVVDLYDSAFATTAPATTAVISAGVRVTAFSSCWLMMWLVGVYCCSTVL
jgi:hypothetical protein